MSVKQSSFEGLSNVLSFDEMLMSDASDIDVNLDNVRIVSQERKEFEDDDNSLAELGKSLRQRQLQPIVIRPINGFLESYELVAGERRVKAARLEGLVQLRARVMTLTDDEAIDARFAENVHRKNLTQIEEASRLQADIEKIGMKATLAKHNKSQAWVSKRIALLSLPKHSSRLVTEKISADPEVITQVATIEKRDSTAAAELVENLKQTRGKANAREKVAAVKSKVKPSTKANNGEAVGAVVPPVFVSRDALTKVYVKVFEKGMAPAKALGELNRDEREQAESWLSAFYDAGMQAKDVAHTVAQNLRRGVFSTDNEGWFAFAAFIEGVVADSTFDLVNIVGSAKE